jgi:YD repeat-containing protein
VRAVTFGRDQIGQLSTRAIGSTTQNFGYNTKDQLTSAASTTYTTDAAGNPTTNGAATQSFDAAGQLCWALPSGSVTTPTCGTVPVGATGYTFDGVGERTSAGSTTYAYDQAGQLTTFTGPGVSATYRYNGDGLPVAKTAAGATSTFFWDNSSTPNILADGANSYHYGPSALPIEQTGVFPVWWTRVYAAIWLMFLYPISYSWGVKYLSVECRR